MKSEKLIKYLDELMIVIMKTLVVIGLYILGIMTLKAQELQTNFEKSLAFEKSIDFNDLPYRIEEALFPSPDLDGSLELEVNSFHKNEVTAFRLENLSNPFEVYHKNTELPLNNEPKVTIDNRIFTHANRLYDGSFVILKITLNK